MENKTTEQKIKEYKEHSKYCFLCNLNNVERESLFDGCGIQIVSISETGQVIAPYDNEFQGMSSMLPMCAYHMVLAQEGLIAMTTQNQIIQSKLLTQLENQTDTDLNKFVLKLNRAKKDDLNRAYKQTAKTIINARKLQIDMQMGVEEAKKKENSEGEFFSS